MSASQRSWQRFALLQAGITGDIFAAACAAESSATGFLAAWAGVLLHEQQICRNSSSLLCLQPVVSWPPVLSAGPCLAADIITYNPACLKQAPYTLEVVSIPPVFANRVSSCLAACYPHFIGVCLQRDCMPCCLHDWCWGPACAAIASARLQL